ncbi:MAG TPA: acyl-CoA dehydrogenase family protein [Candidatus Binataceae bacterium]|nr:acyl-CoA dehydrogenase family protein [Candidatus Binataceae bacterium]
MAIDFTLTESQRELQANARAFAERVLAPVAARVDRIADPWEAFVATREAFREMAHAGLTKSFIPKDYGGLGFSMIDIAIASEELTRIDVNVPTTLLGNGLALQPILQGGTHEQKRRFLADFVNDREGDLLAAFAFTDAGGGANFDSAQPPAGVATIARREGDHWIVNGRKRYTTNGTGWDKKGAHLYLALCRTDPNKPANESLAMIAIPGNLPGIEVADVYDKLGHRGVVTPAINFENVRVPIDNLIGTVGAGAKKLVTGAFSWTAALIGAACVGVMRAAFEYALDFARREKRLGPVPVIEYQSVGYMLADIKMRVEEARYLTWKACHYLESTGGTGDELAIMTKVRCSEIAVQTVYDAMRVVGVESYTKFTPLERLMREAMVFPLYDGGNQGIRRRQLHEMMMKPGYHSMLATNGDQPPWE